MANHLRRMIRERVATMLTGLSSTGSNVFLPHVCPLENDDLPSLCIYTQDEEIEVGASGDPRVYHSTMILIVDGYVQTFSNLDDHLYQIGIEVQVAMAEDIDINNLVKILICHRWTFPIPEMAPVRLESLDTSIQCFIASDS